MQRRGRPERGLDRALMESARGQLLIAGPALLDPNFWRTVVLVIEHTEEGALGLVLNRPSETTRRRGGARSSRSCVDPDEPLFIGGPGPALRGDRAGRVRGSRRRGADRLRRHRRAGHGDGADEDSARASARAARSSAMPAGARDSSTPSSSAATGSWSRRAARTRSRRTRRALWPEVLTRKGGSYALVARMPAGPVGELAAARSDDPARSATHARPCPRPRRRPARAEDRAGADPRLHGGRGHGRRPRLVAGAALRRRRTCSPTPPRWRSRWPRRAWPPGPAHGRDDLRARAGRDPQRPGQRDHAARPGGC